MVGSLIAIWGLISAPAPQVNRDEEVWFHGPYLHWTESGELELVLRGRFVETERTGVGRRILVDRAIAPSLFKYIGKKSTDFDDETRDRMRDRLAPFLADGESRESLRIRVVGRGGAATLTLPKSDSGGHFNLKTCRVNDRGLTALAGDGPDLQLQVVLPENDRRKFSVKLPIPPSDLRLLVISDVDDTVRVAEVLNRPVMIERVFLRRYEAVAGIAATYRQLAESGARIHFVSGSPWQIGPVIEQFLADEQFPPAVLHCRQIGWDYWNSDPLHTKDFKVATIRSLLGEFRSCKVLFIGDDGEHDPEVYSEISREFPDRVAGIWIREVRPQPPTERLAAVRRLVGDDRVTSFRDAAALRQRARAVIEHAGADE